LAIHSLIQYLEDKYLCQVSVESLGKILAKLSVDNWPKELMEKILNLKKKAREDDVVFRMFYNLQNITGRRFIDIKKPSTYDVTIKQEEKSTSERCVKEKVIKEYDIWTREGENDANEEEIKLFQEIKTLFVDADQCLVYTNGENNKKLEKSRQGYKILVGIMKHRGKASPMQIREIIYPTSKKEKDIRSPVSKLRRILKDYKISVLPFRGDLYCLDGPDFVLVKKKIIK